MSTTIDLLSPPARLTHQAIADALKVRRAAVSAWKRRGYVPRKHHARLAQLVGGGEELVKALAADEAAAAAARVAR